MAACAAIACLTFLPLEAHAASKSDLDHKKWWAWAEVGGFYDSEYESEAEVELFFPIAQSAYSLLFLDIEGELFANDMQDGAIALGYRQMFAEGWNLGVWAGPEVRRTREGNRFWRFDAGLELLHPDYDLRFNAYTPFTHAQAASPAIFRGVRHRPGEVVLEGNEIFMWNDFIGNGDGAEVPLWGFDGEVGVRVPLEMAGLDPNNAELRLYGGGFYFDSDEAMEEIAGPKARVELRFYDVIPNLVGSRLTAEYEYSYDDVRGDRHAAGARLRIPFGSPRQSWAAASQGSKAFAMVPVQPLTRQERRMLDALEREDVFTTRGKLEREQVGDYLTGVIFDRVAYVDPGEDLSDVSDASGNNTLIIVNGTLVTTETEDIQGFQTVQGGQSTIPVFGVRSGRVVDFTAPGAEAFIDSTVNGDVLNLLGDHTHIAGLDINGNGTDGHGINVGSDKNTDPIPPGTWNIVIDQTVIHDIADDGVGIGDNNAHVLIFNETDVFAGGSDGIDMGDSNQDVLILGVDIWDVASDGIGMSDGNQRVTIAGVTIDDVGDAGIEMGDGNMQVAMIDPTITNAGFDGIRMGDSNGNVAISQATISALGRDGIRMNDGNQQVTISGTTISEVGSGIVGIGIAMANNNQNVLISGVDIWDVSNDGIEMGNGNSNVTISEATITDVGTVGIGDGIAMANNNQNVLISGVDIWDVDNDGIEMGDDNSNVTISEATITDVGNRGRGGNGIVMANNNQNVLISGIDIWDVGDYGIKTRDGNSNVTISETTITDVGDRAIDFRFDNSDILITGVDISNTGFDGIAILDANTNINVSDTTIVDVGRHGIFMGNADVQVNNGNDQVSIMSVHISNTASTGIKLLNDSDDLLITDVNISNAGSLGIQIGSRNTNVDVSDTTIAGAGAIGIQIFHDNIDFEITNVDISNAVVTGIQVGNRNTNVEIADTTIADSGKGIGISNDNSNVQITNVDISNVAFDGIDILIGNNGVSISDSTIDGAGRDGLRLTLRNTITMTNTTFTGAFGDDVIDFHFSGNSLSGGGNAFNGTFGDQFCEVAGGQAGSFGFDVAPQPTCP